MACGTPVVTSNTTSLPEVVGDAGLMVSPSSADDLAAAILRLLRDADLRADLRERGLQRARAFAWRTSAARTLDAYEQAGLTAHPSKV
jgi:glycosyltransferase involved in cell wall biosynthesis